MKLLIALYFEFFECLNRDARETDCPRVLKGMLPGFERQEKTLTEL
jgi:hypothetical protein